MIDWLKKYWRLARAVRLGLLSERSDRSEAIKSELDREIAAIDSEAGRLIARIKELVGLRDYFVELREASGSAPSDDGEDPETFEGYALKFGEHGGDYIGPDALTPQPTIELAPGVSSVPGRCGGDAVVTGTRVRTSTLADLHRTGDTIGRLAFEFNLNEAEVHHAIAYEQHIRAYTCHQCQDGGLVASFANCGEDCGKLPARCTFMLPGYGEVTRPVSRIEYGHMVEGPAGGYSIGFNGEIEPVPAGPDLFQGDCLPRSLDDLRVLMISDTMGDHFAEDCGALISEADDKGWRKLEIKASEGVFAQAVKLGVFDGYSMGGVPVKTDPDIDRCTLELWCIRPFVRQGSEVIIDDSMPKGVIRFVGANGTVHDMHITTQEPTDGSPAKEGKDDE